jgi:hypothetical protein
MGSKRPSDFAMVPAKRQNTDTGSSLWSFASNVVALFGKKVDESNRETVEVIHSRFDEMERKMDDNTEESNARNQEHHRDLMQELKKLRKQNEKLIEEQKSTKVLLEIMGSAGDQNNPNAFLEGIRGLEYPQLSQLFTTALKKRNFDQIRDILKAPGFGNTNTKKKNAFVAAMKNDDYTLFCVLLDGTDKLRFESDWLFQKLVEYRRTKMLDLLYDHGVQFRVVMTTEVCQNGRNGVYTLISDRSPFEINFQR